MKKFYLSFCWSPAKSLKHLKRELKEKTSNTKHVGLTLALLSVPIMSISGDGQ
jgi:hypothetical protein